MNVWYAVSKYCIIRPIFFDTTVANDDCCDIIKQFISLLEPDERYIRIEQDELHTSEKTI